MSFELPAVPQPMEMPLGGQARSSLGPYQEVLDACLADLERYDVAERIWRGDHTVWKPDPTEITNRLGWLAISDEMRDSVSDLEMFARQIRDEGYRHLVLLGMGGSSLGPEMLRQTFGSASGYPELIVLDSTIPGRIQTVTDASQPEPHTVPGLLQVRLDRRTQYVLLVFPQFGRGSGWRG